MAREELTPGEAVEKVSLFDERVVCLVHLMDSEVVEGGSRCSVARLSFVEICCWIVL